MPIIQPQIMVPDDIYNDYVTGKVKIMGLAKNVKDSRIVKHLDVVGESKPSNNALSVTAAAIISAGVAACAGLTIYFVNQIKVEEFKKTLISYVDAVKTQSLTIGHIDRLIEALDKIKHRDRRKLLIEFSAEDLTKLVECLCYHTQTLAKANNFDLVVSYSMEEEKDILLRLRKNLQSQKQIFNKAV